jgi:hypothetical protein
MISGAVARHRRPGLLEQTRDELMQVERRAMFQRHRLARARLRLRESDALLDLIEECRLRSMALVPHQVWSAVVRLVGSVDAELRDELGIDRHPDHVADIVFRMQETLQTEAREQRRPQLAPIIPLFPDVEIP